MNGVADSAGLLCYAPGASAQGVPARSDTIEARGDLVTATSIDLEGVGGEPGHGIVGYRIARAIAEGDDLLEAAQELQALILGEGRPIGEADRVPCAALVGADAAVR